MATKPQIKPNAQKDDSAKPLTVPGWPGPGINPAVNILGFFKDAVELYSESEPADFDENQWNADKNCGPFGQITVDSEVDSFVASKMSHAKMRITVNGRPMWIYVYEDASRR